MVIVVTYQAAFGLNIAQFGIIVTQSFIITLGGTMAMPAQLVVISKAVKQVHHPKPAASNSVRYRDRSTDYLPRRGDSILTIVIDFALVLSLVG